MDGEYEVPDNFAASESQHQMIASSTADVAAETCGSKEDQKQRAVHSVHIWRLFPTVWKLVPCSGTR